MVLNTLQLADLRRSDLNVLPALLSIVVGVGQADMDCLSTDDNRPAIINNRAADRPRLLYNRCSIVN
jgi:hypothetical protein